MKPGTEKFEQFLDTHLPMPGIVAAAIRLRDKTVITRLNGDALTRPQVEQCLQQLLTASDGLRQKRIESRSLCWTFEKAHVHFTQRPDASILALFSENIPGELPPESAQKIIGAFQAMQ